MFPVGNFRVSTRPESRHKFLIGNIAKEPPMARAAQRRTRPDSDTDAAARVQSEHFGRLVRERREAMKMRQDDLALATGVGRRFILELEAGKPSCQLGRALLVAAAVGLRPFDLMSANSDDDNALLPDLMDEGLPDADEDDAGA